MIVFIGTPGSAGLADRLDQVPLAHLRPAGDVPVLGDLVQLLTVAILQRTACLATALTTAGSLLSELAARALREARDRALPSRRLLCLPDVSLRSLYLAGRRHGAHLHLSFCPYACTRASGGYAPRSALVGADELSGR